MIERICLIDKCPHNKIPKVSSHKQFFYHLMKHSTEDVIEVLKRYDLVKHTEMLGRYTLLNIMVDISFKPFANAIINRVVDDD